MKNKSSGFKIDLKELRRILWEWVQEQRESGIFDGPAFKLCSVNFTFTGHRTDRRTTFASTGSAQPTSAKSISTCTNCIVTCVWADEKNRIPPILFLYSPEFRFDRSNTDNKKARVDRLLECLVHYEIEIGRVVYIGKDKNETRRMVSESPDLIRRFFKHYGVRENCVVSSDNGNLFFDKGKDVLLELGFVKHVCCPPPVHQYLFPDDNYLHGTSKASWRESGINYSDDVSSCLMLLQHLDCDILVHSKN
jgi:hypothetical protein